MLLNDAINRAREELIFCKNLDLVYGNAVDIYKNKRNIDLIYQTQCILIARKTLLDQVV